jgi:hypothetical protein
MKTMNFKLLAILLISLGFITGCGGDEEAVSEFAGDYVITEATLSEALIVPVTGVGNVTLPANTPITQVIQTALLGSVSCSSADKTYIEIREDFSLYLSCEGANPLNAGTWTEVSATELLLNLNSTAVPSSPTGIALAVTEVLKSGTTLTGKTSVPIPKAFVAGIIAPLTLDASAPAFFVVKFSLKLTQK